MGSFAFLNDRALVFPNPCDGTLDIYTYSIGLGDFSYCVSLGLPGVAKPAALHDISICREASTTRRSGSFSTSRQIFAADPDEAIIVFELIFSTGTPSLPQRSVPLVTHKTTLIRFEATAVDRKDATATDRGVVIPWNNWGPTNTRLLYPETETGLNAVHGTRFVSMSPRHTPGGPRSLGVYDFNRRRLRLEHPGAAVSANQNGIHNPNGQDIPSSDVSMHPVATHLPFYYGPVNAGRAFQWCGVMMDDERIVGLCVCLSQSCVSVFLHC